MDDVLLMAVPSYAISGVKGLCLRPDLDVLDAVADDHWFTVSKGLNEDVGAAAVLGAAIIWQRGPDQIMRALVSGEGSFVQVVPLTIDNTSTGTGLAGCRNAVRDAVTHRLGDGAVGNVELVGYAAESATLGRALALVYRAAARADVVLTVGDTWVPVADLPKLATTKLDRLVVGALPK